MLAGLEPRSKLYRFGFVPDLAGLGMLIYVYLMAPKTVNE